MKLCMFSPREADLERGWPGRIDDDRVVQLAAQTLQSYFTGGGRAREHAEYRLDDVVLRAPVLHPPSIRLFTGATFQFGNPASIYGPDEEIPWPEGCEQLGFELRLAAVVGAEGRIGGFTPMIDWTAPDLTPAKDKDFATSIGPVVVTPDELEWPVRVAARVNGEDRAAGELDPPWDELVSRAARNTQLVAGDLLAAEGVDLGEPWLRRGDPVEVEAAGLGVLRSAVR
jgi:2-keto-4-pentenoate hydratase/2-oxohepta-3-ene-1,7-dioic acid hydratase in catechol pathway